MAIVQLALTEEEKSDSCHLQAEGRNLNVSVDVETIVLAGQHHTAVVHQSHIKALGVFHLEK